MLERGAGAGVAVVATPKNSAASPHVVSLHGKLEVHQLAAQGKVKQVMPPRGLGRLLHLLDERIHLHDLRMRTLSIRARGWKDFPPAEAKTLGQAVSMTGSRFFNEHPLAELTVLSLAHMVVLAVMHIAQIPGRLVHGKVSSAFSLPNHPAVEEAPAVQSPSFKSAAKAGVQKPVAAPAARALPLRARISVWLSPMARKMQYRPENETPAVLREVSIKTFAEVSAPVVEAPVVVVTPKVVEAPAAPIRVVTEMVVAPSAPVAKPAKREKPARVSVPKVHFAPAWQRGLAGFAGVAIMLILPLGVYGSINSAVDLKARVMEQAVNAVQLLKSAGAAAQDRDFASASRTFAQADQGFEQATRELGALANVLNAAPTILPGTAVGSASPLLNAAREIAKGGEYLSTGMAFVEGAGTDPATKIVSMQSYLAQALPHLERATAELDRVSPEALPGEYRDAISEAKIAVPKLTNAVRKANAVAGVLGEIMGQSEPKRYLVIFQNNAELRPTGGFMGSFAMMDVSKGKVVNMTIPGGGTYDMQGGMMQKISSPQPLHLINPLWQFHDANWYPDFPTSAKQIAWFYGKSGGTTTDGVIAINASLMEQLLNITGPIDMPEYGKVITADNFYDETQKSVEVEYDKEENKPKKFIGDLGPKVLEKLMNGGNDQLVMLAGIMDDALLRRDVQLWMNNADLQERITGLGWSGAMKTTDGDFVSVIHTNIAGQKTDRLMHDDLQHSVKVLPDGTGIVTMTFTRTHKGIKGAQFSGVRNVDFVRFYVPQGSMLVEARGFDQPDPKLFKLGDGSEGEDPAVAAAEKNSKIDRQSGTRINDEGGKTVFGNWMQTDPGKSSTVTLVYELPPGAVTVTKAPEGKLAALYGDIVGNRRDRLDYTLLVQKQSGTNPMTVTSSVDFPRGFSPSWQSPQRTEDDRGRWTMTATLDRDAFFASVAEGQ